MGCREVTIDNVFHFPFLQDLECSCISSSVGYLFITRLSLQQYSSRFWSRLKLIPFLKIRNRENTSNITKTV